MINHSWKPVVKYNQNCIGVCSKSNCTTVKHNRSCVLWPMRKNNLFSARPSFIEPLLKFSHTGLLPESQGNYHRVDLSKSWYFYNILYKQICSCSNQLEFTLQKLPVSFYFVTSVWNFFASEFRWVIYLWYFVRQVVGSLVACSSECKTFPYQYYLLFDAVSVKLRSANSEKLYLEGPMQTSSNYPQYLQMRDKRLVSFLYH